MSYDVIVGMNVLMQGETVINENGIVIKEKFPRIEEIDSLSVLPTDVTPNEIELNIGPDIPNIFKDKVQQSILSYVPHKTKTTNVELNILVKSNEPISRQPRRLPFSEKKIVQTQEAEWLKQGIVEPCSSEYSSLVKHIEFLGHVVEDGKIFPSTLKTKAVLNFLEPANLKQIHSFLGLTGYFRKFIPKYSTIARPLSDLWKKDQKFKFGEEERISFNQLKLMLAEKPVLRIYNPNYETELHTDASLEGYGAILMQKSPDDKNFHPTYYMSKKTTDAKKKYSSYELEALAVIEAVKKFRV
ncbi:Retrovirus-related Pol polyprotein from transposon 297 [Araneus ventricosus]|uniref:Retrovirus-related Pol polyprotein from transposon 297 n=1 Tax=Araneus ventricosus TaxID=182803 RepID=A0A4Y1ZZM5_ARAVE|nr:Retrovirus-related Pol polyprotein from transposon 297 [Araneus ventricosus]